MRNLLCSEYQRKLSSSKMQDHREPEMRFEDAGILKHLVASTYGTALMTVVSWAVMGVRARNSSKKLQPPDPWSVGRVSLLQRVQSRRASAGVRCPRSAASEELGSCLKSDSRF
jgi:hypothetical protein